MKVIIFGCEQTSQLAKFYFENDSHLKPFAFCVHSQYLKKEEIEGLPVLPFEDIELSYKPKDFLFFAPLYDNKLRKDIATKIKNKGYDFATYISSKSTVWTKKIGQNCFIMEDNTIQPFVEIGNNVILWSGNHIGHHSVIKDNVFFSSHVVLSGNCIVNEFCWLGVNSSIRDHVVLEKNSLIGMGSVVLKSTCENQTYIGNPADVLRKNK
jgi:sugar O-acyltransferase (sialic acid O-acetyltransferase NeuD family)